MDNVFDEATQIIEMNMQQTDMKAQLQSENLNTLLQISQELAATLDEQNLLQLTTDRIIQLTCLQSAAIYLLQGHSLRLCATTPPLPEDFPEALRHAALADHPHIGQAISTRKPVLLDDALAATLTQAEQEVTVLRGLRTILYLPLLAGCNVLGVLIVSSMGQPKEMTDDDIGLCMTLSNLASIAVSNAQIFQSFQLKTLELEQKVVELNHMDRAMFKLSLAVEQTPNSIFITDLAANIEYANATFTTVSGYSQEEILGKNPRILQSGKTPGKTYQDMWAHLTRGEPWRGEFINRRRDGSLYTELAQISPVKDAHGVVTNYLSIKTDITEYKAAEARIEKLAHYDQLTGLPNRAMLAERFKQTLSQAQRNHEQLALMFLDLDRFKNINDTLGHALGDQLLMEVTRRLKHALRDEDTVSRLGGDEFVVILPDSGVDGAAHVASKLIEAISQPWSFDHHELIVTPSIGIAIYPHDGEDFDTLSKLADTAMYRVKQAGRNGFRFYTAEMQTHSARTLRLTVALRHALARNELSLHYQPQMSMRDGHIVGAEALLRWTHPELGTISPAEFVPIAEDSGLILNIGDWVLRTAAQQLKRWMEGGMAPMVMAVNLSAVQFRHANLPERVMQILDEVGLPHALLELELTEAVAMDDPRAAVAVMDRLHERGIRMSIDDFGTGYSSLSYLKKFKVYKLKIDQSFVRDLNEDPDDKAIVTAIINMASSLGMQTIAEGVETASQLAFLRLQGCNEAQGYYFSRPLTAEQFEAFVAGN